MARPRIQHEHRQRRPGEPAEASPPTREAPGDPDRRTTRRFEHEPWTGDVEAQRRELVRFLVGLGLAIAILVPVAAVFGSRLAAMIGF